VVPPADCPRQNLQLLAATKANQGHFSQTIGIPTCGTAGESIHNPWVVQIQALQIAHY